MVHVCYREKLQSIRYSYLSILHSIIHLSFRFASNSSSFTHIIRTYLPFLFQAGKKVISRIASPASWTQNPGNDIVPWNPSPNQTNSILSMFDSNLIPAYNLCIDDEEAARMTFLAYQNTLHPPAEISLNYSYNKTKILMQPSKITDSERKSFILLQLVRGQSLSKLIIPSLLPSLPFTHF